MRQTQRSPEGPRHLHRIPRLSGPEAPDLGRSSAGLLSSESLWGLGVLTWTRGFHTLVASSLSAVKRQGQDLNPNLDPCHFAGSVWVTAWLPQRITGRSSCLAPPGTLLSRSAESLALVLCGEL